MEKQEQRSKPSGIGRVLADLIRENNTNVNEVAVACGIKPTTLYSIIKRNSMSVNIRDLARVARHLGVSLNYFCDHVCEDDDGAHASADATEAEDAFRDDETDLKDTASAVLQVQTSSPCGEAPSIAGCKLAPQEMLSRLLSTCAFYVLADDSMSPFYDKGDLVIVDPDRVVRIGDVGAYEWDESIHVRVCARNALIPSNPLYPLRIREAPARCIGKVIGTLVLDSAAAQAASVPLARSLELSDL